MRGAYSDRKWLNADGHPSTGAVVAYHGEAPWGRDDKAETMTILEVSDCHGKVRLHRSEKDSLEDFIAKMIILHNTIGDFIGYLQSEAAKEVRK